VKHVSLGEVVRIDRTPATDADCRSLPYVGLEHIEKDTGRFASDYDGSVADMLATQFRFTSEHVLYGKLRPYLNKVALPNFDGVCTTEILPLLPKPEKLDRIYLWAMLLSPKFVEWASSNVSGANLPRLAPSLLAEYPIPLLPLAEQQRIAGLLRRADRLRRLRRYALDVSAGYLQAVFVEMFGDPVRNPMGWRRGKLKDLCSEIVDCPHSTPTYSETVTEYACVRSSDIQNGYLDLSTTKYVNDEEYRVRCERLVPTSGDIVYCREGARFGNAARLPAEQRFCLGQRMMLFRPKQAVATSAFIWSVLENPCVYDQALKASGGSASPHVNVADIKLFDVVVPPYSEQQKFAGVVHRHDRTRSLQIEALRQAEHLFQALLRRAFAGE
jgi:type I restriction enzyme S subunit